jgi:hypothetical protein
VFLNQADQPPSISAQSLSKKSELKACEAIADIFRCAILEPEPIGHHPQIATQLPVAFFDMVSDFAAFKCCEQGIGNPPPSYSLPIL